MAACVQVEEGNFANGPLPPPLKKLFLEIQIQKIIHEYLFSSEAGAEPFGDEFSEHKQINNAPEWLHAADTPLQSAHEALFVKSSEAFDGDCKQSPNDPHRKSDSQASPALRSITCIEDCGMDGTTDQANSHNALLTATSVHESSLATSSVESGGKVMHKTAHLSRVGTFPYACNVQLQLGMTTMAKTEIKVSCKKPPRPPKAPKSELSGTLKRCSSDNSAYLQSMARRERKRKAMATATATSNVGTSILAVLFTLCFAILMLAQGFWSQNDRNFGAYGSDASSPTQTIMTSSTNKQSAEDQKLAERQVSMEGFSTEREASSKGGLTQSYVVVRKVLRQPAFRSEALRT